MNTREESLTRSVPAMRGWERLNAYANLLRVRQWVKNGFVLAGVFFSDHLFDPSRAFHAVAATIAFCFLSSAVYVFNDIVDREADAVHPEKSRRPLAAGTIPIRKARALIVILLFLTGAILAVVGFAGQVAALMATYLVLNILYSVALKHVSMVDILIIASGFVLRLEVGIFAVGVRPSSWIVLCTGLLSLFLALAKRRGDLVREGVERRQSLGGYTIQYIDQALAMLGASTLVVYALFTVSPYAQLRFNAPLLYLTTFPVVMGLLRYLQITVVEGRYASPADILLRDRPIQLIVTIWIALFSFFVYR